MICYWCNKNQRNYQLLNPLATHLPISPTPFPPLTIDSIFQNSLQQKTIPADNNLVKIIVTGDIIPARSVNWKMTQLNNFKYPFEKTIEILNTADLRLANLEAPLLPDCQATTEGMVFCGNPKFIDGLKYARIDIVSLANNHYKNYGTEGIMTSNKLLEDNNIAFIDNNLTVVKEIKGTRFGFLAFNFISGGKIANEVEIRKLIMDMKKQADVVIVAFHWGAEYKAEPDQYQRDIAHLAIDFGADLVVGNHPHWVQAIEFFKNKLIVYAHGNYIFDQMWSEETRQGVIGEYIFAGRKLIDVRFFPTVIEDYVQPRPANTQEANMILLRMKTASEKLLTPGN